MSQLLIFINMMGLCVHDDLFSNVLRSEEVREIFGTLKERRTSS